MTALDAVLATLDALIATDDPADLDEADRAVWSYLAGFDGITAQTEAAEALDATLAARPARSQLLSAVRDIVARHRARLAEPSA